MTSPPPSLALWTGTDTLGLTGAGALPDEARSRFADLLVAAADLVRTRASETGPLQVRPPGL